MINRMNLVAVRSRETALELLGLLGYDAAAARPFDLTDLGWEGVGTRLRSERSPARGYGVLVAETPELPRSLRTFGRRLVDEFHDRPLGLIGIGDPEGWREWVLIRPRLVRGGGGAVSIAKLHVDRSGATAHDVEVISGLAWSAVRDDAANQDAIDQSLDVDRVTRRFFIQLNEHYQALSSAIETLAEEDVEVRAGVELAGDASRVALRIVTQTLFCYFLQRKGLLEGDRNWLSATYKRTITRGAFYQRVMEPLFYEALSKPVAARDDAWRSEGLPFLNGGLFERHYGGVSLPLDDALFSTDEGLLGFLDAWSFTVDEDTADETEVAVDPEMLGKIFENLIAEDDRRAQGTIYTPRPVVQFMCREALVLYLQRVAQIQESAARTLVTAEEPFDELAEAAGTRESVRVAEAIGRALAGIRVLDPAVGSGAFLLGMLSEILRLRRLAHAVTEGVEPSDAQLASWKLNAIEHGLFGVDINPTAVELCRLRLWLSLLVEAPADHAPDPLPNLEYRTICADSLTDFVAGEEVQNTRGGLRTFGFAAVDPTSLLKLRDRYFVASDPNEKERLRSELASAEDKLIEQVFRRAAANAQAAAQKPSKKVSAAGRAAVSGLESLRTEYRSRDRVYPVFLPAFHAPDVVANGGWDVVIMNPPYVGRKEVPRRIGPMRVADLERHYGRTYDLMLHFGFRALQLVREGGAVSMIFNDSIFTSTDATDLRVRLLAAGDGSEALHAAARTRCFEGVAVNGGVIAATRELGPDSEIRWVENHGHPPRDLLAASQAVDGSGSTLAAGSSEVFEADARDFRRLPHRPLFRPNASAICALEVYEHCASWRDFSRYTSDDGAGDWSMLSATPRLNHWIASAQRTGFYDQLRPGRDFVLLGLVTEGGQGLATADDRRFVGAIEGTREAEEALARRERLEQLTLEHDAAASLYRDRRAAGEPMDVALLAAADCFHPTRELGWPKGGAIRIAAAADVRTTRLSQDEVEGGIESGPIWAPFEKGDSSTESGAAAWCRDNPLVIDWSPESVELLRTRAASDNTYRKPYFRNEGLWGKSGITWNKVASYFRVRLVPEGTIPSDGAFCIRPIVSWLSTPALLALLNAPVSDFILRTFVVSRMNNEVGGVRRLPIPVLDAEQQEKLHDFGCRAVAAKRDESESQLSELEAELDLYMRDLYRFPPQADLSVVR
jgi:hypothetical protein